MATNRLYIVNTETDQYCCLAKSFTNTWSFGNANIFERFLNQIDGLNKKSNLIIGTENDSKFWNRWIKKGINFNESNKWKYY